MPTPITIRPTEPRDFEPIADLVNHYILNTTVHFAYEPIPASDYHQAWLNTKHRFPWLTAELDNQFAGYAKATTWRERTAYDNTAEVAVYVSRDHHRRGVARALYTELLNQLRHRGFHTAIAGLTLPNDPSIKLHESMGFEYVATYKQVGRKFDQWHDVAFYQLML